MDRKPEEYSLEYAGFWIRFAAGVIDLAIILSLVYSISSICMRLIYGISPPLPVFTGLYCNEIIVMYTGSVQHLNSDTSDFLMVAGISIVIVTCYTIGMWVWQGQTLGKMVTGIKIIRTDSSPLTFIPAVKRFLGCILCVVIVGIGFLWIVFDSRKQGIHDKIADTYVVKLPVRQVMLNQAYMRGHVRQI